MLGILDALAPLIDVLERALPSAIGSLIGSLTGVFTAFALNRRHLAKLDERRIHSYLKGLTNEIKESIDLLNVAPPPLRLLPNYLWESALHSGDLALFPYEVREDLRTAYFAIAKCNYQFKRTIGIGDKFRTEPASQEQRARIQLVWQAETAQAYYMSNSTLSLLRGLSKKQWFTDASQYSTD